MQASEFFGDAVEKEVSLVCWFVFQVELCGEGWHAFF